jgi:hypothetical protein
MHGALVMKFLAANTCLYCEPPLVRYTILNPLCSIEFFLFQNLEFFIFYYLFCIWFPSAWPEAGFQWFCFWTFSKNISWFWECGFLSLCCREHLLCFGHFGAMINPLQQFVEMQGAVVPNFMAATTWLCSESPLVRYLYNLEPSVLACTVALSVTITKFLATPWPLFGSFVLESYQVVIAFVFAFYAGSWRCWKLGELL